MKLITTRSSLLNGGRALLRAGVIALCVASLPIVARAASPGFADLVERVMPAVVHIETKWPVPEFEGNGFSWRFSIPDVIPDNSEEFWFRNPDGNEDKDPPSRSGSGSGFIIDPAGYIVTNQHVIDGVTEIEVTLNNRDTMEAIVIGSDVKTDIALLKIEPEEPLEFVRFGDSDQARIGDLVVAIGSPFGLGGSVSAGIISARNRDINSGPYDDYIQTDAAINKGNSGGPLFNVDGQVIGVNTAITSPSGVSAGIGFAVPSVLASNVIDQLREFGHTRRGWLGVAIQEVTDEIAEGDGLDEAVGAMVSVVGDDGPAANAGVMEGDIIVEFDDRPVKSYSELPLMVAETEVGKEVRLKVWRGERFHTLFVEIGLLEEGQENVEIASAPELAKPQRITSLGMELAALDSKSREKFEYDNSVSGVLVVDVSKDSPARQHGIEVGAVIAEVNRQKVSTPEEVRSAIARSADAGRRSVLLLVNMRGAMRYVGVRIDS